MKSLSRVAGWILCAALLSPAVMVGSQRDRLALVKQSSIIFVGTVTKLGAVSFAGVPKSPQTIVVRVDAVLKKPAAVSLAKDSKVTVEVKDASAFQEGTQATFYAEGWILGAGVAVKEVGHEIAPATLAPTAVGEKQTEASRIQKQISDAELSARIKQADMVVVGRVVSVRPFATPTMAPTRPHISEHAPNWQEAVIQVESGLKGAKANQKVVVRFPGSMDVAWYGAPKFKEGQEATFILKKDQVSGAPKSMLAGVQVNAYTALKGGDALSKADAARVRALFRK